MDGVEGAQARLHRAAALVAVAVGRHVRPRPDADVRMRIHQAGNDRLAGEIDDRGAVGDGDSSARPTAMILPPWTTSTPLSIGGPSAV